MSDFGDYLSEMKRNRTTNVEIENLFSGSPNLSGDLKDVNDFLDAVRVESSEQLSDDTVSRFVAVACAASAEAPTAAPVRPQLRSGSLLRTLRRRVTTVTVAATVVLGGTSGLALAADDAKPGDALYGIDRALETVGIGAGALEERLFEAEALVAANDVSRGLDHATQALESQGDGNQLATTALIEAAQRVQTADDGSAAANQEGVAGLLAYLSENVGNVDGQAVAELASQIGRGDNRPGVGSSDTSPPQRPTDPPGLTDDKPGRPEDLSGNPPGQDKTESGPPDHVPVDPPGQDKAEPGPPDHVPADPPGQDKKLPKPPKDKP